MQKAAASTIQNRVRSYQQRTSYLKIRSSALLFQARWRFVTHQRLTLLRRQEEIALESAATTIQTRWRMLVARKSFLETRAAAVTVQRFSRGCLVRRKLQQRKEAAAAAEDTEKTRLEAAVTIQSCLRMRRVRREFLAKRWAAVTIQAAVRGHQTRMAFKFRLAEVSKTHTFV